MARIKMTKIAPGPKNHPNFYISDFNDKEVKAPQSSSSLRPPPRESCTFTEALYPIILLTKWTWLCPIKTSSSGRGKRYFHFSWISLSFILSLSAALLLGFSLAMFILNVLLHVDKPIRLFKPVNQHKNWISENILKGSKLIRVVSELIKLILPVGVWLQSILQWINVRSLCEFLNEWPKFHEKFRRTFSFYSIKHDLVFRRNLMCIVWFLPTLLLLIAVKAPDSIEGIPHSLSIISSYMQVCLVAGSRSISYVRDLLLLRTLTVGYNQVLKGIKEDYKVLNRNINNSKVRGWLDLITFLRVQTKRVETYLCVHNLWSIFEVFMMVLLILSMVVFLFMNNSLHSTTGTNFLPYALFCTSCFMMTLYWKSYLADEITEREENIVEEIICMETGHNDCETLLEIRKICDFIYNDPVKVRFGRLLTLDKRLLLEFFGQLASYLVVILQFLKTK